METVFVSIDAAAPNIQTSNILDTYRRCCCISLISEAALLPLVISYIVRFARRSVNVNQPLSRLRSPSISLYLDSANPFRRNRNQFLKFSRVILGRRYDVKTLWKTLFLRSRIYGPLRMHSGNEILGQIFLCDVCEQSPGICLIIFGPEREEEEAEEINNVDEKIWAQCGYISKQLWIIQWYKQQATVVRSSCTMWIIAVWYNSTEVKKNNQKIIQTNKMKKHLFENPSLERRILALVSHRFVAATGTCYKMGNGRRRTAEPITAQFIRVYWTTFVWYGASDDYLMNCFPESVCVINSMTGETFALLLRIPAPIQFCKRSDIGHPSGYFSIFSVGDKCVQFRCDCAWHCAVFVHFSVAFRRHGRI